MTYCSSCAQLMGAKFCECTVWTHRDHAVLGLGACLAVVSIFHVVRARPFSIRRQLLALCDSRPKIEPLTFGERSQHMN